MDPGFPVPGKFTDNCFSSVKLWRTLLDGPWISIWVYAWQNNRPLLLQCKIMEDAIRIDPGFPSVYFLCLASLHCYKTLRRIPPPWPDGAEPNGQGRGKWLPYIVREFTALGTEVFHDQPKFSVITGNFRRKKRERAQGRIELTISGIPILSSTPRLRLSCT